MKNLFRPFMIVAVAASLFTISSCTEKVCDAGYEGDNCKTEVRAKFLGNFTTTETCSPSVTASTWTTTVTTSSADVSRVVLGNFGDSGSPINATVDGSNITLVSGQKIGSKDVSGQGTITADNVTINFSYNLDAQTGGTDYDCQMVLVRQ